MTLTLSIQNAARLENGAPTELVLHRRGAMIGRSPTCDWSLPDPRNYISSRHCEVAYRDGFYVLTDVSTNGTFLNGSAERMAEPRRIVEGDRFLVGQYELLSRLTGEAAVAFEREQDAAAEAASAAAWTGWDSHGGNAPPAPAPTGWDPTPTTGGGLGSHAAPLAPGAGWNAGDGWAAPPAPPAPAASGAASDWGAPAPVAPASSGWGAPPADASQWDAPPASGGGSGWAPVPAGPSTWEAAAPPPAPASGWSSAVPDQPPPPSTSDVWGELAAGNVVDWAASGFGQPIRNNPDPLGLVASPPPPPPPVPTPPPPAALSGASTWSVAPPAPPAAPGAAPAGDSALVEAFAAAAGLKPGQLKAATPATLDRAGQILRRLVGGLVVMLEARARAKSQLGAEATSLSFDGNNPMKFARTPEQAVAQLLNPAERGFMDADKAIEDAFLDLQSHQVATLKAMQGALRATLDRFSPTAIRARAESRGLFARILPGAREAALWQAYEREFSGVAQGSDEAFMDMFAKEFRRAYEEQTRGRR